MDRVITICLDLVNTWGKSPNKLLNIIKEKRETKIIVLILLKFPRIVLNSLWRIKIILDHNKDQREGEAQKR